MTTFWDIYESVPPGTPGNNFGRLYVKTDNTLHFIDDLGVDTNLLAGGGGGVSLIGIMGWDEGVPLNTGTILNVVGSRLNLSLSGTVFQLQSSPDPIDNIGIMGQINGVSLGTGTTLNVTGDRLGFSISGTSLNLYNSPDPIELIGIFGRNKGSDLATGTILNVSGTRISMDYSAGVLNITNSPDPIELIGIMAQDEGSNLGTGTTINFQGSGIKASFSGTILGVNVPGEWGANILMGDGSGTFPVGNQIPPFEFPFDAVIDRWTLVADVTGSIQVRVWKDTYANYPPTSADLIVSPSLSNQRKNQTTGLALSVTAGDIAQVHIETSSTIKQATLSLRGRKNIV